MAIDVALLQSWVLGLLPWGVGLAVLMLLDGISGALEALYAKKFEWEYFPEFLWTGALYLWAWLASEILGVMPVFLGIQISGWEQSVADLAPKAVFAFIAISKYAASIAKHIQKIKDIPVPEPAK